LITKQVLSYNHACWHRGLRSCSLHVWV